MKRIVYAIATVLLLAVVLELGKPLYLPLVNRMLGMKTVGSMSAKLESPVFDRLQGNLDAIGLKAFPDEIVLVGLKEEHVLEVYAATDKGFRLLKRCPFTGSIGVLGAKLKEGDGQIPEGVYQVESLNPNSAFYLSVRIDYPNEFDVSKTEFKNRRDMGATFSFTESPRRRAASPSVMSQSKRSSSCA